MPRTTTKVTVDATALLRDSRQLVDRLRTGGMVSAREQADRTAAKIAVNTPVRTGALRSTVGVTQSWVNAARGGPGGAGWGATYGSGATYHYVQNARRKIVKKGMRGCRQEFRRAVQLLTEREVNRV